MSTQINVTVGDQRLLQTNKTRAAANQQNLDDRLTENKTAAALEPELKKKRQEEEQPGAIPVRRIPRRPAAQRRAQETALLFYDFLRFRTVEGSGQSFTSSGSITVNTSKWSSSLQNFVYATAAYTFSFPSLHYENVQSQPTVYFYGPLKENTAEGNVLEPVGSQVGDAYTLYFNVRSIFLWYRQRRSVLRIGIGTYTNQTFVDSFASFPLNYYTSQVGFRTAVQSSTDKFTFVSYIVEYNRNTVSDTDVDYIPFGGFIGPAVPNYIDPVSATDTFTLTTTLTRYTVAVYISTNHTSGISTYRTINLGEVSVNKTYTGAPDYFEPKVFYGTAYTQQQLQQQQVDFIANMDLADPRRAIYAETSRLDYALDTVINGCMYNPRTGGAYATGFDSEGKKVIVAKGQLQQNLDYYTALLIKTKPAAAAIKNSVASQVPAQLPAEFSIYNQFTNTVGTDPLYGPGDLGRMFVAYGT